MRTARKITIDDVLGLEVRERIRLVEAIWNGIGEIPEAVELSDEQRDELDKRLEAYAADPQTGSPWSEVKAGIVGRRGDQRRERRLEP